MSRIVSTVPRGVRWQIAAVQVVLGLLLSSQAVADPVVLKLGYFSSDRTAGYVAMIKPFVDAVNADPRNAVKIEAYPGGKLGPDPTQQSEMIRSGAADLALVVPELEPAAFPDTIVLQVPGVFRDFQEASLVYAKLIETNMMRGYENFHVVGAYETGQGVIHLRPPMTTLADLKGKRIRVNGEVEVAGLRQLGVSPVVMPAHLVNEAINAGQIDGATAPLFLALDLGITRLTTYHYMLPLPHIPAALVMSKARLESLPKPAQETIRKYSGRWASEQMFDLQGKIVEKVFGQLQSDSKRHVIFPSDADIQLAQTAFQAAIQTWLAENPRNEKLLEALRAEIGRLRSLN